MFSIMYFLLTASGLFFGGKFLKYADKRLKEEGYVSTFDMKEFKGKDFKGKLKDLLPLVPVLIAFFAPIIHIATVVGGVLAFKDEGKKEEIYEGLKNILEKTGLIINENKFDMPVAKKRTNDLVDDVKEEDEEVKIHTNQAASDYWARMELEHKVPKIDFNFGSEEPEEEKGYQKQIKR